MLGAKCTHPVYLEQSVDSLDRWFVLLCSSSCTSAVPDSGVLVYLYYSEGKSGSTELSGARRQQLERTDILISPHRVDCTKSSLDRLLLDSLETPIQEAAMKPKKPPMEKLSNAALLTTMCPAAYRGSIRQAQEVRGRFARNVPVTALQIWLNA